MLKERPIVLSIAGFDPCGGAGVLADIKTIEQHQVQGMAIITAHTIQTEQEVAALEWQPLDLILTSIRILAEKYPVSVAKIGIVSGFDFLHKIVDAIKQLNENAFIVWDPIISSSSGRQFFEMDDVTCWKKLAPHIDLITPNYLEYELLKAYEIWSTANAILIKGGHRDQLKGTDLLIQNKNHIEIFPTAESVHAKHGSGCVLSAAIASNIALGYDLPEACRLGKIYVERFLNSHPSLLGYHHYVS
ncbi:hydroxymethylpyrimidine/phosphomethylpyrimidine kinase [Niabella insulamsoli]|uniref:hydroxymethylpyrimidine/phosphomethylpyrimidine kinase n=1 Tax=Niabella insulamsoli TaxID=3144874 RepID=UPI0031FC45B5